MEKLFNINPSKPTTTSIELEKNTGYSNSFYSIDGNLSTDLKLKNKPILKI